MTLKSILLVVVLLALAYAGAGTLTIGWFRKNGSTLKRLALAVTVVAVLLAVFVYFL